ncbi:hypothetical protein B0H10DRAFT_2521 [Mycena sp. CBHHK59/15]|nr:hypothetical protein B0H10DRAFT_2521 [Mycena sp. CBHHK59/15]
MSAESARSSDSGRQDDQTYVRHVMHRDSLMPLAASFLTMVPSASLLICLSLELFSAFLASSLIILVVLRAADVRVPTLAVLKITALCTVVVFAALRAVGILLAPRPERDTESPSARLVPTSRSTTPDMPYALEGKLKDVEGEIADV